MAMEDMRKELVANRDMLIELRNKHLSHCAAVVLAIVQKRIEAADAVLFRTAGVKECLTTEEAATVKESLTVQGGDLSLVLNGVAIGLEALDSYKDPADRDWVLQSCISAIRSVSRDLSPATPATAITEPPETAGI